MLPDVVWFPMAASKMLTGLGLGMAAVGRTRRTVALGCVPCPLATVIKSDGKSNGGPVLAGASDATPRPGFLP